MTGAERIAAERKRQIEQEGWTPDHDDSYQNRELEQAAVCYALPVQAADAEAPMLWPFDPSWWKSNGKGSVEDLVKAGALIAAAIDRKLREDAQAV